MSSASADFWSLVDSSPGLGACWPWRGSCDRDGYGIYGRDRAHRVAYVRGKDRVPGPRAVVRHTCDNPRCCNPLHLIAGTQQMNVNDRNQRGRTAAGEKNGRAVLDEATVLQIFMSTGSYDSLAAFFNVSRWTVRDIKTGRNWGWLTGLNSHRGNKTIPTTRERLSAALHGALRINELGGVAEGTRTLDDQNHNLGSESSIDAGCSPDEGDSCD